MLKILYDLLIYVHFSILVVKYIRDDNNNNTTERHFVYKVSDLCYKGTYYKK